ncbi:nucleotidyltransferase domain-containing protein [Candidatus Woesearchaeota archaeon]|nr:nucleotidyltransferase domain-containing protein [Candidatus Woesearchaeota archaeon]
MFEKLDKTDLKVLNLIAGEPYRKFYLREIAKELKISSSSAKKALDALGKLHFINEERMANLRIISGNMDEKLFKQFKIMKNIDLVKPLLEQLEPALSVMLYGSFAKGENDMQSDIDLLVITNKKDDYRIHEFKNYPVQIIKLTPAQWKKTKEENQAFASEVKKGVLLKGEAPE